MESSSLIMVVLALLRQASGLRIPAEIAEHFDNATLECRMSVSFFDANTHAFFGHPWLSPGMAGRWICRGFPLFLCMFGSRMFRRFRLSPPPPRSVQGDEKGRRRPLVQKCTHLFSIAHHRRKVLRGARARPVCPGMGIFHLSTRLSVCSRFFVSTHLSGLSLLFWYRSTTCACDNTVWAGLS